MDGRQIGWEYDSYRLISMWHERMTDWLTDWLPACLPDWLTDWLDAFIAPKNSILFYINTCMVVARMSQWGADRHAGLATDCLNDSSTDCMWDTGVLLRMHKSSFCFIFRTVAKLCQGHFKENFDNLFNHIANGGKGGKVQWLDRLSGMKKRYRDDYCYS